MKFAEVVLNTPIKKTFIYCIPKELEEYCDFGYRISVNFNGRNVTAYIIDILNKKPPFKTKEIISVLDDKALFSMKQLEIAKWMSDYYLSSLGEALYCILPSSFEESGSINIDISDNNIKELLELNEEQKIAVDKISKSIDEKKSDIFCLHGITGSGKTEIYKHLAKKIKNNNKITLILVPEISLTPQTIKQFKSYFGNSLAILHSHLNPKEKLSYYRLIQEKKVDIVLGARSAIFCPPENLGLIVIDEEHETTYKSEDTPRYHARQIAIKISKMLNIPLVLGSATPSIETYYHANKKSFELIKLVKRHGKFQQANIKILDLKQHKTKYLLTSQLKNAIIDRLNKKQQTLIFLNKRGYASFLLCPECGYVKYCPDCNVSMTYHKNKDLLICHYCNRTENVPNICPDCGFEDIKYNGIGTEKVLEIFTKVFSEAVIERMDADTTRKKNAHKSIIDRLENGEIDILIGTQMITKGLHIPNITLVGVLIADTSLNIPDFRASERTFNLLAQVAGRAGRGEYQGDIIIQTYNSEHSAIRYLKNIDYESFYKHEVEVRSMFKYPPFSRFIRLVIRGIDEKKVEKSTIDLYNNLMDFTNNSNILKNDNDIEIIEPSVCPLEKLKKYFRWQILIKGLNMKLMQYIVKETLKDFKTTSNIYIEIDIDPTNLL